MHGSVPIYSTMRVIDFSNRAFDLVFSAMIIRLSIFKIIIISIWTYIKLSEEPSQSKFIVEFLNESISL